MALGFPQSSQGGGEFKQIIKYDAKAGRMFRVDRVQGANGFESRPIEITQTAMFIADMANIRVGWIFYSAQGPLKVLVPAGAPYPLRPEGMDDKGRPAYKAAFELDVMLHKDSGGGDPREFSSSAGCVRVAMEELHNTFIAAPESKQHKLPVVRLVTTVPTPAGTSTNYAPVFEIVAWVDRPTALAVKNGTTATYSVTPPAAPVVDNYAIVRGVTPPATGSTQVAPPPQLHHPFDPPPVPPQKPEPVGEGDFG